MEYGNKKRKKCRKPGRNGNEIKLLGVILFALGAITICTFILPLKAMIVLLSIFITICGILLFIW